MKAVGELDLESLGAVGARIVEAARVAVAVHLYRSAPERDGVPVTIGRSGPVSSIRPPLLPADRTSPR